MVRAWFTHDFSAAHADSFYQSALHTITLVVKKTLSAGIKVFLQYGLRISAVADSIFEIDIGILRILRPLISFETPVLFVCVNPGIFTIKYVTYLLRPTFINFNLSGGRVATVSVTDSGA